MCCSIQLNVFIHTCPTFFCQVMMIEEVQYEDGLECHHSYDKRCHTTYTTDYEPQQVQRKDSNPQSEDYEFSVRPLC
jgi:hypothetical protein